MPLSLVRDNPQVAWSSSGKERYCFESPALCMVFNGGELSLVEYGYVMYSLYTRPEMDTVRGLGQHSRYCDPVLLVCCVVNVCTGQMMCWDLAARSMYPPI